MNTFKKERKIYSKFYFSSSILIFEASIYILYVSPIFIFVNKTGVARIATKIAVKRLLQ